MHQERDGLTLRVLAPGLGLVTLLLVMLLGAQAVSAEAPPQSVIVAKVWDAAPSNAFTDLIWFNDRWILAFREGTGHSTYDGSIRVLASVDGDTWQSAASLALQGVDLRDPKLSVTPQGVLMLNAAQRTPAPSVYNSLYWTSTDGSAWSGPALIGDPNMWLWRVTWSGSMGYTVGYRTTPPYFTSLYTGNPEQGIEFTAVISPLLSGAYVNETAIIFSGAGDALAVTRRDPVAPYTTTLALLGSSAAPYDAWTWQETNLRVGGPDMLRLADGRIVVGARLYTPTTHTGLVWLDPASAMLSEFVSLPSGGDTGYPGMVHRDGKLWVSYYSSHEGKASIYFGSVDMPLFALHLNSLKLTWSAGTRPGTYNLVASLRAHDENHAPAPDATVAGRWTTPNGDTIERERITRANGVARFNLRSRLTGVWQFCVTDLSKPGFFYDPASNDKPDCETMVVGP